MDKVYYWLGFGAFWLAMVVWSGFCLHYIWTAKWFRAFRRRIHNIGWWLRVFLLRIPVHTNIRFPQIIFGWYQRPRTLDGWERRMIAHIIRYNRRHGFKPEEA